MPHAGHGGGCIAARGDENSIIVSVQTTGVCYCCKMLYGMGRMVVIECLMRLMCPTTAGPGWRIPSFPACGMIKRPIQM